MGDEMSYQRCYNQLWVESKIHSPGPLSTLLLGITSWFSQESGFMKETLSIIAVDIWSRIYTTGR